MRYHVQVGDAFEGDITINVSMEQPKGPSTRPWKIILFTICGTLGSTAIVLTLAYTFITGDYTFLKRIGNATAEVALSAAKATVK
jgi:hypothetical protein